jgi:SAM-dependent methyltransferase
MRQRDSRLKRVEVDPASVTVPADEVARVVEDMRAHAGELAPTLNWAGIDSSAPAQSVSSDTAADVSAAAYEAMTSMQSLLDAWVGNIAMRPVEAAARHRYEPLLAAFDPLGLWQANVVNPAPALRNADLGSILDVDILYAFTAPHDRDVTRVLELGGGYGRLAEAMLNVFGDSVRYVMIDAVPASLCYARAYLAKACPGISIGYFYDGDDVDLDRYQCYIAPAWHFTRAPVDVDVCVNVESFQEMSQEHLDFYLALFDRVLQPGGLVYSSNARSYAFTGVWRFPSHWRKLLAVDTPRSWTDDHPTEIFEKTSADYAVPNALLDAVRLHPLPEDDLRSSLRVSSELLRQNLAQRLRRLGRS